MTTGQPYTICVLAAAGAAFCFRQAYRAAGEPMTSGCIHVTAVEDDDWQEAAR